MTTEIRSKSGAVSVRQGDDGKPSVIEGYAAVYYDGTRATEYELWPGTLERIMPRAFDDRLTDDVRALFNHDRSLLRGRNGGSMRLFADDIGLRYEIDVSETSVCQDLLIHLERGDVTGSSFGFRGAIAEWEMQTPIGDYTADVRNITGFASLFDVGPVVDPAYTGTTAAARNASHTTEARQEYDALADRAAEAHRKALAKRDALTRRLDLAERSI